MSTMVGTPVLVGVDGSPSSLHAVELAATEAALRRLPLHIVHAFLWPASLVASRPAAEGAPDPATVVRAHAAAIIEEAKKHAENTAPGITVTTEEANGPPAFVLSERSRHAALSVVGDRGAGRFEGMLAGTVATQLATYGSSPVIVVRGHAEQDGPVVVGIDGSPRSEQALDFAAQEASLRGTGLTVVHVWRTPVVIGPGTMTPLVYDLALLEADRRRVLSTALAGLANRHPGLSVQGDLGRGSPGSVLESRSRGAQMIVVGDRGHGGFAGLLIGSVSQHLIFHSACPVAVIRGERRGSRSPGNHR